MWVSFLSNEPKKGSAAFTSPLCSYSTLTTERRLKLLMDFSYSFQILKESPFSQKQLHKNDELSFQEKNMSQTLCRILFEERKHENKQNCLKK